jgi:hypothetical protein
VRVSAFAECPFLFGFAVFDKSGFGQIDVKLANIFDVIADAFEMFGDEKQMRRAGRGRRIVNHHTD